MRRATKQNACAETAGRPCAGHAGMPGNRLDSRRHGRALGLALGGAIQQRGQLHETARRTAPACSARAVDGAGLERYGALNHPVRAARDRERSARSACVCVPEAWTDRMRTRCATRPRGLIPPSRACLSLSSAGSTPLHYASYYGCGMDQLLAEVPVREGCD